MDKIESFVERNVYAHKRLAEAESVIARLSQENTTANSIAENWKQKFMQCQDRNINLQRDIRAVRRHLGKFPNITNAISEHEDKITWISLAVEDLKEKVEKKVKTILEEVDLKAKVSELEKQLEAKENELNSMRVESHVALDLEISANTQLREQLRSANELVQKLQMEIQIGKNSFEKFRKSSVTWADATRRAIEDTETPSKRKKLYSANANDFFLE